MSNHPPAAKTTNSLKATGHGSTASASSAHEADALTACASGEPGPLATAAVGAHGSESAAAKGPGTTAQACNDGTEVNADVIEPHGGRVLFWERLQRQLRASLRGGPFGGNASVASKDGGTTTTTSGDSGSGGGGARNSAIAAPGAVPDPPGMLEQHVERVSAFLDGCLAPYPREQVRDTHGAKARRVLDTGLGLLKYYNPLVSRVSERTGVQVGGQAGV
jgi:hypothetical protein